jgi:hypothetical protein
MQENLPGFSPLTKARAIRAFFVLRNQRPL